MDVAVISKNTITVSEKEQQIIQMLTNGLRTKAISERLDESVRTTEARVSKLLEKFNCETQAHLVAVCMDAGIATLVKARKKTK